MRFTAALILTFFVMASSALAMDTSQIAWYAHGDLSLPMGSFGDFAGTGFGGGIGGALPYNESLTLRGEVGYIHYGGKDFSVGAWSESWNFSMIPIMLLGEYQFEADSPLYGLGGIGFVMARSSVEWEELGQKVSVSGSNTDIGLAIGGGYHLNEQMTIEGRYNIINNDFLTVHFLYNF
jgi:opacity protein-like surface antigen